MLCNVSVCQHPEMSLSLPNVHANHNAAEGAVAAKVDFLALHYANAIQGIVEIDRHDYESGDLLA